MSRLHARLQRAALKREQDAATLRALSSSTAPRAPRSAPADPMRARGVPIQMRGVPGHIPGTRP